MASYGYARVSTLDQDLTVQRQALRAAGCGVIRAEKASGSRRDGRTELQVLLDAGLAGPDWRACADVPVLGREAGSRRSSGAGDWRR